MALEIVATWRSDIGGSCVYTSLLKPNDSAADCTEGVQKFRTQALLRLQLTSSNFKSWADFGVFVAISF